MTSTAGTTAPSVVDTGAVVGRHGHADGRPADFLSGDFLRVEDGELAEHWDTVEYTRLYYALGMLPEIVSPRTTSATRTGA